MKLNKNYGKTHPGRGRFSMEAYDSGQTFSGGGQGMAPKLLSCTR